MPLPANETRWPPVSSEPVYRKYAEWSAWYSGDPDRIIDAYAADAGSSTSSSATGPIPWWRFWSRARANADGQMRAQLHVPLASDLAAVSGALLFGEPPKFRVRAARAATPVTEPQPTIEQELGMDPTPVDQSDAAAMVETPENKTETRLIEIAENGGMYARLVEAAESAAAIGGVFIYPVWDVDLADHPIMAIAQADMALPEFRHGILTAVTFWRTVEVVNQQYWRHIERHEVLGEGESRKAVVMHGLYVGSVRSLGFRRPLDAHPETAGLEDVVELPFQTLDVRYVPNIRPNRLWRSSALGVADIQGSETLLDALDETYASWMRDVRLAKARILVPREYLRMDSNGNTGFDIDQEIYVPMEMEPGLSQDARAMLAHQFQIRYLEHRETATSIIDRIVSNAGYVPQTLGEGSSLRGGDTGTALRIAEHKTLLTLRKKSGWWRHAIADVLEMMLAIDKEVFGTSGIELTKPTVQMSDSIIDNPLELAQTALALKTAESASIETRVRLVHPDWSNAEVMAEVARIEGATKQAQAAAVTEARATFGGDEDPASTDNQPTSKTPASGPVTNPQGNQGQVAQSD